MNTGFGSTQPTFNFGAPQQQPQSTPFGTQPQQQPTTGFTFNPIPQQQPQATAPRFGNFGTTTGATSFGTTNPTTSFAFPPATTNQPSTFFTGGGTIQPFGTQQSTLRFPSFVTPVTSTMGFGTNTGTSGFAFPATSQPSLFSGLQGFGTQQQQQQFQQQQQIDPQHAFYQSIFQCNKFGDERDIILANFNYLQACLGTGKGYYSQTLPPVIYTLSNPFCRCKAVGYSFMYSNNNEDGLVSFEMKKSPEKIRNEETPLIATLQSFLNRQNIIFKIAGVKGISEEQSFVNVFAEDQTSLRRIPATDLAAAMNQLHLRTQLDTWGITNVSAKVKPSPEQLKRYLETAPEGIDPRVWKQAQDDNPDPENMIPAPVIGVDALKKRIHIQETESEHHSARVALIQEESTQFQNRCSTVGAEILQLKRKQAQLSHRLLSVIARLEISRKGLSNFQPEEMELSRRLQSIEDELNSPTEYKGRLKELISQLRLQQYTGPNAKYTIDETSLHEIKEFLTIQQKSMKHLVDTVKGDVENLHLITDTANDPKVKVHKENYQPAKD